MFGHCASGAVTTRCGRCTIRCLLRFFTVKADHIKQSSTSQSSTVQIKRIDLVPARLHEHLFGKFQKLPDNTLTNDPFKDIELPELEGSNVVEHFQRIGERQFAPYKKLLEEAANLKGLPRIPKEWSFSEGWTMYNSHTGTQKKVTCPLEDVIFFDVEVCVNDGLLPTLATALTPKAWYSWCSKRLVRGDEVPKLYRLEHLIALESEHSSKRTRVVVGHNIAYDRSRVREQYDRKPSFMRFWDTMSMAIAIYGMADHQVALYEKKDTEISDSEPNGWMDFWRSRVCKNSLYALHEKLCSTSPHRLNKSLQTFFIKENISEIRNSFQELMTYCCHDVLASLELYQAVYPEFEKRFPHPVTWQGMLEVGNVYLPVTKNWRHFFENNERNANTENKSAAIDVVRAAHKLVEKLGLSVSFKDDPWMWSADWTMKQCGVPCWFESFLRSKHLVNIPINELSQDDVKLRSRIVPRLFGLCWGPYPLHYKSDKGWGFLVPKDRKMIEDSKHDDVSAVSEVKLRRGEKAVVPVRSILGTIEKNKAEGIGDVVLGRPDASLACFEFHKLPHPAGAHENVGDPLAKTFLIEVEEGVLWPSRFADEFYALLKARNKTRFWGNYRARLQEQLTIWFDEEGNYGAIAPSIIPFGTITRRSVHKLWLTAINPKDDEMIGTDLKSMVECPHGWHLVGADVDSQEQWIAALLGDCAVGKRTAGATPFSNMLLAGSKADHSDLHSVVAREVGISRDKAKVLNYARLYGAGVTHAAEFLKQSGMEAKKASRISDKLFTTTRGKKHMYLKLSREYTEHFCWFLEHFCDKKLKDYLVFTNNTYFLPEYRSSRGKLTQAFEDWLITEIKRKMLEKHSDVEIDYGWLLKQLYGDCEVYQLYSGGFESDTFNYLELMLHEVNPRTPVLDCCLGYALTPIPKTVPDADYFLKRFRRSITNWVVQSSAVDFLHLLIVCMNWLCDKYNIRARFALSIHDEIRYFVASEDRYRCSLALSLSNMYCRAMISHKLGILQLPMSVAFFSQVEIDKVLRKEVNMARKTPCGILIDPGEALDMQAVMAVTNGSLKKQ